MEEWKEFKLSDLTIMKNGKKRPSCIGQYPVYGGNGIMDYADVFNAENTIVVGRVGAYCGNVYYCSKKCWVSDNAIAVFANDLVDIKYLFYLMSSLDLHHQHIGGAQPLMTQDIIGGFKVFIPSLNIQEKIASFLSSLDDKIELNRRINENLEQQAQALFKSWFVDFEPFKDGKFVDSELGMIPEGWKVGTFKDIIHSILSGDWGKECKQGNYTQKVFCIRGADIPNIKRGDKGNMPTRFIIEKNFQSKALMDGDMVIEVSGGSPTQATGRACRISHGLLDKYNHSIVCTNFCRAIKPLSQYSSFLYYMWEMFYNQGIMFSYENGTTGIKNLDINGLIQKEPIIIPPVEIALEFEKITQIYYERIQSNGVESEKLSQLRNTLLPRLMSGELKISDIENKRLQE